MLAGSVSVKFVGIFVVFLVGFRAIADLWDILGDLSRPVVSKSFTKLRYSNKRSLLELHSEALFGESSLSHRFAHHAVHGYLRRTPSRSLFNWPRRRLLQFGFSDAFRRECPPQRKHSARFVIDKSVGSGVNNNCFQRLRTERS